MNPGDTVSHYRIVSKLGEGGMGEVFIAADESLERQVALKILPEDLVRNPDRLRRFMLEAKTASGLNHPNIVTVYEIGVAEDADKPVHFIAMELIRGKTLREALPARPPLKKTLEWIAEVAEGLAKAHAAGIVHRDIKPENIMLTEEGRAKIVDFGIAKLIPTETDSSDTAARDTKTDILATHEGVMIGTVGYMSPEQVEGLPVDSRADIFSLGCVLYEAVTGRRAFQGTSRVDTMHQIVSADPKPIETLTTSAPADLQRVVDRCLAKNADERYQSVKEIAIELRRIVRDLEKPKPATSEKRRSRTRSMLAAGLILLLGVALWIAASRSGRQDLVNLSTYRFTPIETSPAYEGFPAWSPDGRTIAYVGEVDGVLQIFTRALDTPARTQITHLPRDCREPFWSPDGSKIYFISLAQDRESLWAVGAAGGEPRLVIANVSSAALSPDGKAVALLRQEEGQGEFALALWFANSDGTGAERYKTEVAGTLLSAAVLRFAPDGKKLGAWVQTRDGGGPREFWEIAWPSLEMRKPLPVLGSFPRNYPFSWMSDSRRIVFGADFDERLPGHHLWIADTKTDRMRSLTATQGNEYYPAVSPDGSKIIFSTDEADFDLIEIPLDGSPTRPLLATARVEKLPTWSPDGSQYAYVTNRNGFEEIWMRSADGAWERPIATTKDFGDQATFLISNLGFSPDGRRVAYQRAAGMFRVWISSVLGGPAVPLNVPQELFEDHPTWSPDGNWIAYTSYIKNVVGGLPALRKVRVGSGEPSVILLENVLVSADAKWSPNGEWITTETMEGVMLISADGSTKHLLSESSWFAHEWARDGKSIYAIRSDEELHLILVQVAVPDGDETILRDLGPAPPMNFPFQGLSFSAQRNSLATSTAIVRGDLWLLEGFETSEGLWSRFATREQLKRNTASSSNSAKSE